MRDIGETTPKKSSRNSGHRVLTSSVLKTPPQTKATTGRLVSPGGQRAKESGRSCGHTVTGADVQKGAQGMCGEDDHPPRVNSTPNGGDAQSVQQSLKQSLRGKSRGALLKI